MEERVGSFTVIKKNGKEELVPNLKDPAMAARKKIADKAAKEAKKEAKTDEKSAAAVKEVNDNVR